MAGNTWNFFGHEVTCEELDLLRTVVNDFGALSREELASTVCELLGWTRTNGRLKARECREFLERLETAGEIKLPAKRIGRPIGARTSVPVTARGEEQAPITGTVSDFAPLEIGIAKDRVRAQFPILRRWRSCVSLRPRSDCCSGNSWAGTTTWATQCRSALTCAIWYTRRGPNPRLSRAPSFRVQHGACLVAMLGLAGTMQRGHGGCRGWSIIAVC